MKHTFTLLFLLILFGGCQKGPSGRSVLVSTAEELATAIADAEPGAEIVMANGEWKDVQIRFAAKGTEKAPITLKAETAGQVLIQGDSDLKLGGEHLVVEGLYFVNGASPSRAVIQFYLNDDTLANHSRVTNCVIKDFNKSQRNKSDLWVLLKGRHNQLDHCYLAGKSNRGPTIRVDLEGNQSINNFHKINDNHFGPRPPKGGPSAETIQIGNSATSMSPSYTQVYNNLFDRCSGEVEVISSKSNFNEFRNNVFYKSQGSLVTRHGNYCIIDGNYFIGDQDSRQVGGVRLIGTGHWVTNNYFYNLSGEIFRAPIAVMNGIPRSSINRYIQVTDVNIAYNTFVNCVSPWQFGVGSNVDQKDVLPASEIRSLTPVRTVVANNVIFNDTGDALPIFRHDSIDGVTFKQNVINNQGLAFRGVEGLKESDFSVEEVTENVWVPTTRFEEIETYQGFEYETIENDLFGNARVGSASIGAGALEGDFPDVLSSDRYGPAWFDAARGDLDPVTHSVASAAELLQAIEGASPGDVVVLAPGNYTFDASIVVNKKLTIQSQDASAKSLLRFDGEEGTPAFEMHPNGDLRLESVILRGNQTNYAFATRRADMSSHYDLEIEDAEISNFDYVLKAYKYSFAEFIAIKSTMISNCKNGLELSGEDDDRGEYNAENIFILDSEFQGVGKNVIDYYRGGYDESTVGGNLVIKGSSFTNSGHQEENGILINTYGIINVSITESAFRNNNVKMIARLWGAKNNTESNNRMDQSGRIVTEQNLPLKLIY